MPVKRGAIPFRYLLLKFLIHFAPKLVEHEMKYGRTSTTTKVNNRLSLRK